MEMKNLRKIKIKIKIKMRIKISILLRDKLAKWVQIMMVQKIKLKISLN